MKIRKPGNHHVRRAAHLCGAAALALLTGQSAFAATPADNTELEAALIALTSTEIGSLAAGLLPPPADKPAEAAGLAAAIASKNLAASFDAPDNWASNPNWHGGYPGFQCAYRFTDPVPSGSTIEGLPNRENGIEAIERRTLFLRLQRLSDVWRDLNSEENVGDDTVRVYHPNADVSVSVSNPLLGLSGRSPDLVFPPGRHELDWKSETIIHPVLDIALPTALFAASTYAEYTSGTQVAAKAAGNRSEARETLLELGKIAAGLAVRFELLGDNDVDFANFEEWKRNTSQVSATNRDTQTVTIWDVNSPYIIDAENLPVSASSRQNTIVEQTVTLEATDFGGIRFARGRDILKSRFVPVDDCGSAFDVTTEVPGSYLLPIDATETIDWSISEIGGGPYAGSFPVTASNHVRDGDDIRMSFLQRVTVVDTQAPLLLPPAGFARYDDDGIDLTTDALALGRPRALDVADPSPMIWNDAPDFLAGPPPGADGIRHTINWWANDISGNESSQFSQTVTLKRPGTNTAPQAISPGLAQAVSGQAIDIRLTGQDVDLIDGQFDPLEFRIDTPPANGLFEAPLYPYFIEDFRLTTVGEREEGDELTRVSPLLHLVDRFRLALHQPEPTPDGSEIRGTLLNQEICVNPTAESQQAFAGEIPINFPYRPTYVYVDEHGFTYMRDSFFHCDATAARERTWRGEYGSGELFPVPRISKWSPDGEFIDMMALVPLEKYSIGGYDSVDCADSGIITGIDRSYPKEEFYVGADGRFWMTFESNKANLGLSQLLFYCAIAPTLDDFVYVGDSSTRLSISFLNKDDGTTAIAATATGDLLYESTWKGLRTDLPGVRGNAEIIVYRTDGVPDASGFVQPVRVGRLGLPFREVPGIPGTGTERVTDFFYGLRVDSEGYVYAIGDRHRIHKFEPTTRTETGSWQLGKFIGWLGACSTNKTDPTTGVPYNRCNEDTGTSYGFSCSDQTCNRAGGGAGSEPGQFNSPARIEFAPGDVFYVADTGNSRIQRFASDGTFAGQARSEGTGVNQGDEPGFVLGNFGMPTTISVNSGALYVMTPGAADGDEFVHSFKTSPFRDVTDDAATVRYVSGINYRGSDSFSFLVDDGIDRSASATVDIDVTRAFRPPRNLTITCFAQGNASAAVPCELDEDGSILIRLRADDPDGFVSDAPFGLDTLTFDITRSTANGSLVIADPTLQTDNAATYLYTPNPHFHGEDSLEFSVSDGALTASETGRAKFTVRSVPDPTVIAMGDPVVAGRGFPVVLTAEFSDADKEPDRTAQLVNLQWGDGAVAHAPGWANSGNFDPNGREISPQLNFQSGSGMLMGTHVYANTGNYSTLAVMVNPPGDGFAESLASGTISVIEATMLNTAITLPDGGVDPDVDFPIEIRIRNLQPDGWSGLVAGSTRLSIEAPAGMNVLATDPRCMQESPIVCDLGDLAPGAETSIGLSAKIDYDAAIAKRIFILDLETMDDGPKVPGHARTVATVVIADDDADGVINVDDMFPDDPRWSVDSDGDGLADAWELEFGFDPLVADDVTQDIDNDGYTLLEEFHNGSVPYRNEIESMVAGGPDLASGILSGGDQFGRALAGGDLNLDGYADTVIGSPRWGASGRGAVLISYGAAGGAQPELALVRPTNIGTDEVGRAVAVGDWDGNGFPDLAIGADNALGIHFNNGQILAEADAVIEGFSQSIPILNLNISEGLGAILANGDLDGDGIDDLVVAGRPENYDHRVRLYLSQGSPVLTSRFDSPSIEYVFSGTRFIDDLSIADIDGDGTADLLIGSGYPGKGQVHGFLGIHNAWQAGLSLTTSFILEGASDGGGFGRSVASGADIGGDGVDDLAIGAPGGTGNIYVFDSTSAYWQAPTVGGVSSVPADQTFGGSSDAYGASIAIAHLNTDSYADVVVGANRAGDAWHGQISIYRGSVAGLIADPQVIDSEVPYSNMGFTLASPGDVDGDGIDDLAVGAPIYGSFRPGFVRMFYRSFVDTGTDPNTDSDGDGVVDASDVFPYNPLEWTDTDGDGVGDNGDAFPNDPSESVDSDGDGVGNNADAFPNDASETADLDGDGVGDNSDAFPSDPNESADTDFDGIGNNADPDDDNDGVDDASDDYPLGRFDDVRPDYWSFRFVETLARAGVTSGCGNDNYCPLASVSRAQMAVFLERGMRGSNFRPPAASGNLFLDVGADDFAAGFIEQLYLDGITAGCGNLNFCPENEVSRAEMAVFLLRGKHGSGYTPPPASGIFDDVDLSYWAAAWIEQLAVEGITSGCGGGNYCPEAPVNRAQVAVFLVRAFGL